MGILQLSLSGAALVGVTALLRAALGRKLPRGVLCTLWWVAALRFLVPVALPFRFSAFGLLPSAPTVLPETVRIGGSPFSEPAIPAAHGAVAVSTRFPFWQAIWLCGLLLCAVVFAFATLRSRRMLRQAEPVSSAAIEEWLVAHPLRRPLCIRVTPCLDAPMTCGVLRPVIYLPPDMAGQDDPRQSFALEHEFIHIRRFDMLLKLLLVCAACVHWFNPFAWLLLVLAGRDIELCCDYQVVRRLGGSAAYARTLLTLEAHKSGFLPIGNHFNKDAIEERIVSIMQWKKVSRVTLLCSAALIVLVTAAFATSPARQTTPSPAAEPIAAQVPQLPTDTDPKTQAIAFIQQLYDVDASQLALAEETHEDGREFTFGDREQDTWYYKVGMQGGSTQAFTFAGRYHGNTAPAVSGPLEDASFQADDPAIRETCETMLREVVGVDTPISRARVYACAATEVLYADMVGVEFALSDGQYCTVTLQYPTLTLRSFQLLSSSYLDNLEQRGSRMAQVLFDTL